MPRQKLGNRTTWLQSFTKERCPVCGKMVAENWWIRHWNKYHAEERK